RAFGFGEDDGACCAGGEQGQQHVGAFGILDTGRGGREFHAGNRRHGGDRFWGEGRDRDSHESTVIKRIFGPGYLNEIAGAVLRTAVPGDHNIPEWSDYFFLSSRSILAVSWSL